MKRTKIDWCDCTVNPVVGCPNGCDYCYARKQNNRFHYVENWDKPEYKPATLKQFRCKNPKSVFIDSMSDIGCWKLEWFEAVISAIRANPQHHYIALTKRLDGFREKALAYFRKTANTLPFNLFVGMTVTEDRAYSPFGYKPINVDFLSIEPILQPIDILPYIDGVLKVIIIGAETGNRKEKVIPKKRWVDDIVAVANVYGIKVFMKESLRKIMGDDFRQDELPWRVSK